MLLISQSLKILKKGNAMSRNEKSEGGSCSVPSPSRHSERNVHRLTCDGKEFILIGTAHVSRESADLVERVITGEKPDTVCVELCKTRFEAIKQKDKWQDTDIIKVIREKRASLLLSQLLLTAFQKKIAKKLNINPGEDMMRAITKAEESHAEIVLADREIRISMLRVWRGMRFFSKVKLLPEMLLSLFITEEITEEDVEKLKHQDALELAMRAVAEKLPELKNILIDERDRYLAHAIGNAPGHKIVAVVGAGHIAGVMENIGKDIDIKPLLEIPPVSLWVRVIGWGFPLFIIGLFIAGFFHSGAQTSMKMILGWSAVTASFSGMGALLLLAHPLTIIASALAAPITTLHPLIAAGWVAGLTEVTVRKPKVRDFLDLAEDATSILGFFRNKITRVLLLVAVVNLTTSIGTFVAIPVIIRFF
ncbi:MAG: TraB/GumN family protein [Syntrophales bacterium]|nr:TraB/GumN family protein [Syntrophales bacterium]